MNETLTQVFQRDVGAPSSVRLAVSRSDKAEPEQHLMLHPYGIVGRSPNCDIRLKDAQVSFRHAYLQMIGGRLYCADLGSRSGTRWGKTSHRAGWLTTTDDVSIGPYHLRVMEEPHAEGAEPLPVLADFDPLAIYDGQLGELPNVRLEFLNAADDVDMPLRRLLTFAGSARGCKLRFEGDRISRVHCSLLMMPSGLWVIDLLGKGGTKVNGTLVRSDRLNDGDILKLGQFQMRVRYDSPAEKPFTGALLPPETSVETSSSTDEQLAKAVHDVEVSSDSAVEFSDSHPEVSNHCGRLIDDLVVNRILTREKIDAVLAGFGERIPTFDELSERLVELELITQWQADQLANENHGPLVLEHRYQLVGRLGFGSMGNVYLAFDEALQSHVAIKIPHHSSLNNERLFKRFRRETLISANLVHHHIVRALNIGRGNQFVVLELVDGLNLRELMNHQGVPDRNTAVTYLIQIAEAVKHAECAGVVHRDIKPSNILISQAGTAKLFDFGLAHLDDAARRQGVAGRDAELIPTRAGFAVGTVQYMSPEQARESDEVDTRSDIYSLGCTFYEMLTGLPPFIGENQHQILRQHARDPIPPIADLDPMLAEILDRMLAKDPEQRIQSPQELIDALRGWQEATGASPAETPQSVGVEPEWLAEFEEKVRLLDRERDDWQKEVDAHQQEIERQREDVSAELERQQLELQNQQQTFDRLKSELDQDLSAFHVAFAQFQAEKRQLAEQRDTLAASATEVEQECARLEAERKQLADERAQLLQGQNSLRARAKVLRAALAKWLEGEEG